jgi:hypothetical protein
MPKKKLNTLQKIYGRVLVQQNIILTSGILRKILIWSKKKKKRRTHTHADDVAHFEKVRKTNQTYYYSEHADKEREQQREPEHSLPRLPFETD